MLKKRFLLFLCLSGALLWFTSCSNPNIPGSEPTSSGVSDYSQYPLGALMESEARLQSVDIYYPEASSRSALPTTVDLSAQMPTPGNQGEQGSCVGWATAYALKSFQEGVEEGWPLNTPDHQFSPAWIYNQINDGADNGSYILDALDLLVESGCDTLDNFPYSEANYTTLPDATSYYRARPYRINSYQLLLNDSSALKTVLASGEALVCRFDVYDDFVDIDSIVNIFLNDYLYDDNSGTYHGGHAVCIVGYDDSKQAFKFINSYGADWGDNGYGWISYDFVNNKSKVNFTAFRVEDGTNASRYIGWLDDNDHAFLNDNRLTLINSDYSWGAIANIDITTGEAINIFNHSEMALGGWLDSSDHIFLEGNILTLINTDPTGGAIRTIDINTGSTINTFFHSNMALGGWLDSSDHIFLEGNILTLINTDPTGGAIRTIDTNTGSTINTFFHSNMALSGWLDSSDHIFLEGNILTLINTDPTGGAIRTIDTNTGNTVNTFFHSNMALSGWLDSSDRAFVEGNILTLINTDYTGGAIRTIDTNTGNTINNFFHSNMELNGWLDSSDRAFAEGNILTLINTDYTGGAIRTIDTNTGNTINTIFHTNTGLDGWLDATDYAFHKGNILTLINTDYIGGAFSGINTTTNETVYVVMHQK